MQYILTVLFVSTIAGVIYSISTGDNFGGELISIFLMLFAIFLGVNDIEEFLFNHLKFKDVNVEVETLDQNK